MNIDTTAGKNSGGSKEERFSRRKLLAGAAAGAALTIVPRHVLGGAGHVAPSEKIVLAGIGMGGQGLQNMVTFSAIPRGPGHRGLRCEPRKRRLYLVELDARQGTEDRRARDPAQRAVNEYYAQDRGHGQVPRLQRLRRLPRTAGQGKGGRRDGGHYDHDANYHALAVIRPWRHPCKPGQATCTARSR